MMESLWKDLPSDILERVATFLPLESVIRFTCVSKGWNALIYTREFMLRHALAAPQECYVLVTTRNGAIWDPTCHFLVMSRNGAIWDPTPHWQVLNTARTAFFTLRNDFLTDYVVHEGIFTVSSDCLKPSGWTESSVVAADGGLVCVSYFSIWTRKSVLLVCNPLLRSVRRLPELETWGQDDQLVVMATNRQSMEYQVFVVNNIFHPDHPNVIYIYESKTGAWKESSSSLLDPTQGARFTTETERFIMWEALSTSCVRNKFYKLIVFSDISLLVSFNTVTGAVSEVRRPDVKSLLVDVIQLVVVQDRLFYVAVDEGAWIQVFEVREEEEEEESSGFVTEMPDEFRRWVLGDISVPEVCHPFGGPVVLFAVGCGRDALLFCSALGRSVAYDLNRNAWDYCPDYWLGEGRTNDHTEEICGSNYCLSLCPP